MKSWYIYIAHVLAFTSWPKDHITHPFIKHQYLGLYFTSVADGSRCLLVSKDALSSTTGAATTALPRAVEVSLAPGVGRVSAMLVGEHVYKSLSEFKFSVELS